MDASERYCGDYEKTGGKMGSGVGLYGGWFGL